MSQNVGWHLLFACWEQCLLERSSSRQLFLVLIYQKCIYLLLGSVAISFFFLWVFILIFDNCIFSRDWTIFCYAFCGRQEKIHVLGYWFEVAVSKGQSHFSCIGVLWFGEEKPSSCSMAIEREIKVHFGFLAGLLLLLVHFHNNLYF